MSMVLTRSPLESIGMNGAGTQKRRSARLSHEGNGENEPPNKKAKVNPTQTTVVSTKDQDGDNNAVAKRRSKRAYDEEVDGFSFSKGKGKKVKETNRPVVRNSTPERQGTPPPAPAAVDANHAVPAPIPAAASATTEDVLPKTAQKKPRRKFPTTPEREAAEKPTRTVRRSQRTSNDNATAMAPPPPQPSPQRPAHARSHANAERSPSPEKARPVTVEKKRKKGPFGAEEEEKIMRIAIPFQDTPVIRRNKEMRKASAEGHRRSSSGMRGRRASSLIDEGRGNALPHAEVPATEFFKHISASLTEPRRMRCLLGWCGTRTLPPKPEAPKSSDAASTLEFQALQAARVIQEELSQELVTNGRLSDWFSRDETVPSQAPLQKKPNPRNLANAKKADELERELERLKKERAEWDDLIQSAAPPPPKSPSNKQGFLSPLHPELLDSPQRAILSQLLQPPESTAEDLPPTDPTQIQNRLRTIAENMEFAVDQFAHGIHALSTTRETGERLADKTLADAATVLEERDAAKRAEGKGADAFGALKALGKVMNGQVQQQQRR